MWNWLWPKRPVDADAATWIERRATTDQTSDEPIVVPRWKPLEVPAAGQRGWAHAGQEDPNCTGADAYFAEGLEHMLRGRYEQAVEALSETLRLDTNDGEAYQQRASAWLHLERYDLAAADATLAIQIDAEDFDAYRFRGRALLELGQYQQAIANFDRLLQRDPNDPEAFYGRGLAFFGLGMFPAAADALSEAIRAAPRWVALYEARAAVYERLGRLWRAQRDRKRAARLDASRATGDSSPVRGSRH